MLLLLPMIGGATEPRERAAPHSAASRPRIGRIFFSPAERRLRREGKPNAAEATPETAVIARSPRLLVNGAVSSSTRGRAVWVNGAAVENSPNRAAWTDKDGNIWLRDDGQRARLIRPGQAIDRSSGAIEDLLPSGSVTRH
jgi:hypothetical protein